MVMLVSRY